MATVTETTPACKCGRRGVKLIDGKCLKCIHDERMNRRSEPSQALNVERMHNRQLAEICLGYELAINAAIACLEAGDLAGALTTLKPHRTYGHD